MNVERVLSLVPERLDEVVKRAERMADEGSQTNVGKGGGDDWSEWYSQREMTQRRTELDTELRKLGDNKIKTNVRTASDKGEVDEGTGRIHVWAGTARYQIDREIQRQRRDQERAEAYRRSAGMGPSSDSEDSEDDTSSSDKESNDDLPHFTAVFYCSLSGNLHPQVSPLPFF